MCVWRLCLLGEGEMLYPKRNLKRNIKKKTLVGKLYKYNLEELLGILKPFMNSSSVTNISDTNGNFRRYFFMPVFFALV